MATSTYERELVPRHLAEETAFFEVKEIKTNPSPGGVRVKVTFQSGVKLNFQLDPAKSCDLVEGIAAALAAHTGGKK